MNILVVDDEIEIADLIELYLTTNGYHVYKAYNGKDALKILEKRQISLAILDVMMPDIDGFTLCETIRKQYNFPIIMVTAKVQKMDKITGLTKGADDYITKPFEPLELVARVKAQLRRFTSYNNPKEEIIVIKDLIINPQNHTVTIKDQPINLTPTEFSILLILAKHKGTVVKTEKLFEEVWHEPYIPASNNTIMVHIRHLREKLNKKNDYYIKTIWGVGYEIE
ncbi:MAG TPA: response regulator transcription factor [Candidatus Coprosoma intestinipullorum]|uniref:Response regulator transcription factor n=1 Tax=Candidatus Coprosoma intestinipullorum TaxID=2840752 RepID=A0A9D0ZPR8_9FIRM|nr:response regulator transcription factor [Candidatus Coprosoma intestinipullorum]